MKVEIIYDAKCKHCRFFTEGRETKVDGTPFKRKLHFCNNSESTQYMNRLTLKSLACEKIKL